MTLLFAWLARWVDAVAAAAVQRALVPITQEQERMSLNLDKLAADVDRVKTGVGDLRSQIAALSAANTDDAQQVRIDALDASLAGLFPDAPAPAPAPVATDTPAAAA